MSQPLRVLLVEDQALDAELVVEALIQAGFDPDWRRVENEAAYLAALAEPPDIILADFNMPAFGAAPALELLKARDLDIPFIVVSGSVGEETAVQVLKSGAADYLLKDRLARLGQAVQRAIDEHRLRRAKRDAEQALSASEERALFVLEAAHVGTWESDVQTGATRWSATLETLHGLAPGAFGGTFSAFLECVHPEDRPNVLAHVERATRDRTNSNILYRTQWPDGSIHWISGIGRTFYDDADRPLRAAGVSFDVTERVSLEEQYRQAQKMEAIGQLAGGVAHDFNNVLTAIEGYCTLASEGVPADHLVQDDLREIHRAAERATSLTRQLLAFSRRQVLQPRVLDLRESLSSVAPMLKRLIGEHIAVVVRATGDVGRVKADPGQIEQVVLNLAVNARDAMPNGGTLVLEVADAPLDAAYSSRHVSTKPGRYVMLAVSDTGEGMDATTQSRVFEPFFTTKPKDKGTGLGLSTVYGIVKQSNGYIWLYSEVGHGSTFKVYLPRVEEEAEIPVMRPASSALGGSETILIVEDENAVRELVRRTLVRRGYHVLVAPTPHDAIGIAAEAGTIHLLISDVVMPEMSGTALASQLLHDRPSLRVLYMSGYTDSAIVHHGVSNRGTPFLQKPFTPDALVRKVRDVLD